jgi:CheY-like chemotaxis protein
MANVLIIDDHQVTQRVLAHIVQKAGHEVVSAWNGREGWEILQKGGVDLVLLDIAMPEMDGLTLLEELRSTPQYANLPVLMLTASGDDQDQGKAKEIGVQGFLNKPVSSWELTDAVQAILAEQ